MSRRMIYFLSLCDNASYEAQRTQLLERSFAKYMGGGGGATLHIIREYAMNQGKYNRIIQIYTYLRNHPEITDDSVIVYVDGFDTIVMKPLDGLEADFRASEQHIIFGAHHAFKYIYDDARKYYDTRYKNAGKSKYLTSNFFVGYKWAILQFFQYIVGRLQYYPKPDKMIHDRRVIGYLFYQKDAKEYGAIHKALHHLKLDLDTTAKYVYTKDETQSVFDLLSANSYFFHFPHLEKTVQQQAILLVAKCKDLI